MKRKIGLLCDNNSTSNDRRGGGDGDGGHDHRPAMRLRVPSRGAESVVRYVDENHFCLVVRNATDRTEVTRLARVAFDIFGRYRDYPFRVSARQMGHSSASSTSSIITLDMLFYPNRHAIAGASRLMTLQDQASSSSSSRRNGGGKRRKSLLEAYALEIENRESTTPGSHLLSCTSSSTETVEMITLSIAPFALSMNSTNDREEGTDNNDDDCDDDTRPTVDTDHSIDFVHFAVMARKSGARKAEEEAVQAPSHHRP
jgi:hypothetical protein